MNSNIILSTQRHLSHLNVMNAIAIVVEGKIAMNLITAHKLPSLHHNSTPIPLCFILNRRISTIQRGRRRRRADYLECSTSANPNSNYTLRTCKNCKTLFDPAINNPSSCRFHTAHFAGETKRKFESVHSGGTMNTPDSGKVVQYWHCCGSEDPFDPGCTAAPHMSYDD